MKTWKKFFALTLALLLCVAMAVPALAADENLVKITMPNPTPDHTYDVYQIFTGDVYTDESGALGLANVKYGQNYGTTGADVPLAELEKIKNAEAFAKEAKPVLKNQPVATLSGDTNETNPEIGKYSALVAPGYYLIVDKGYTAGGNPPADDTNSAYIVQIVGDTTITPKTTTPSLDKEVENEEGDFGANADHAIGETFQFKLTARVPVEYLAKYDKYFLKFSDTMSAGITFEDIASVQVTGGSEILAKEGENPGYTLTSPDGESTFSVAIDDLFPFIGGKDGEWPIVKRGEAGKEVDVVEVVVTYNVHLNENAKVTNADGEAEHETNKAKLEYSNNPNTDGTGETNEKDTEVYSIQLDVTKYANDAVKGNELAGAGFTLYDSTGETVIPLYTDGTNYYVWPNDETRPKNFTAVDKNEIITKEDGKVVINGLDVGTYVLKETTTPTGYNTIDPITIEITAEYIEKDGKTNVVLKHKENEKEPVDGTKLNVINTTGTLLPSTGGMGTTLLYVAGGLLVVGAAVILVVRKSVRRRS